MTGRLDAIRVVTGAITSMKSVRMNEGATTEMDGMRIPVERIGRPVRENDDSGR